MPFGEELGHACSECWVHNAAATTRFCFTQLSCLSHGILILLFGGGQTLSLIGDTSLGFSLFFFVFFDLGDELLDVSGLIDLFFNSGDLLVNLVEVCLHDFE